MLTLEIIRITAECLLVTLIWLIQLIIYPNFTKIEPQNQARAHLHYTLLITAIISPIIFTHLSISAYELKTTPDLLTSLHLALTLIAIISTVFRLAPIHLAIILFGPTLNALSPLTKETGSAQ